MQIINHEERLINYSIKQSNSRINVGIGEKDEGAPSREGVGDNKKGIGNYPSLRAVAPLVPSCQKQLPRLCFISPSLKMTLETLDFFFSPNSLGLCTSLVRFFPLPRHLSSQSSSSFSFASKSSLLALTPRTCSLKLGIGGCDLRQLPTGPNFIPGNSLFTFN